MTGSSNLIVRSCGCAALTFFLFVLLGCGSKETAKPALEVPMVTVAPPVERTITRYEYATGRTAPLEQVEIRARVNGYLKKIYFKPGQEVTKGEKLFEIDPEPYKADLAKAKASQATAEGELATADADLARAKSRELTTKLDYERAVDAFKKGVGAEQTRDIAKGMYDEAISSARAGEAKVMLSKAKIKEAEASVRTAELNLGYCSITAPIEGVVGDWLVTEGNLVVGGTGNTTLLTTIVAVKQMDVAFDVDENTLQRIQQAVREGKIKMPQSGEIPAEMGLALHGKDYPIKGVINFSDNKVDTKTGTIRMKARFNNDKPATGQRVMAAGMYARLRVPIGEPVSSMLVPESAFGSDQGIKFLFLVGPENKAVRFDARLGGQEGEMRVVESVTIPGEGKPRPLSLDDRIIVTGLQRVRPGMIVDPKPAKK